MATSAVAIRVRDPRSLLLRLMLRFPLWLYATPLRLVMGRYYIRIKHRGRRSGKVYSTMVDIVHHDRESGEIFVSSGWGDRSDWWRNLKSSPALEVTIGGRRFVPEQRFLDEDEAYRIRRLAWKRHPIMSRITLLTVRYPKPAIDKDLRKWARDMPFVAFRPASNAG